MNILGNFIWWIFGGLILALVWFLLGILLCITIVGMPFGIQCIKISGFIIWPFGRDLTLGNFGFGGLVMNVIWIMLVGWELAIAHLIAGLLCGMSIIGIPFAFQHFKLAKLSFLPFGAEIY